jgi:hypothetical protein
MQSQYYVCQQASLIMFSKIKFLRIEESTKSLPVIASPLITTLQGLANP